MNDITQLAEEK